MKLYKLKNMIDYLAKHYPELLDDYIYAEHDIIYLPKPKQETEELFNMMEECGFFKESSESMRGFC